MDFQRADRLIEEDRPFALVQGSKKGISFDITLDRGFPFTVSANVILSPMILKLENCFRKSGIYVRSEK